MEYKIVFHALSKCGLAVLQEEMQGFEHPAHTS